MRSLLVIALILATTPAWAAKRPPGKQARAAKHWSAQRKVARQRPAVRGRKVRLGLVPHKKGVANLFWNTKAMAGDRQDPSIDGTFHRSIPLN